MHLEVACEEKSDSAGYTQGRQTPPTHPSHRLGLFGQYQIHVKHRLFKVYAGIRATYPSSEGIPTVGYLNLFTLHQSLGNAGMHDR